MLYQIEGSNAIAKAVALCRPAIICAYPITPQTHIVENLGEIVRSGGVKNCEFINVESEMAALSVAIGSEAAGARSYTATSSQGLLLMMEALYNASGLELPIVMTLGNRAIGSPLNIWNDHSDAMAARDAGWVMLFAESNQEAVDLHIQAFKIAEKIMCPVMVCVDGFILTHAYDRVDVPSQEEVDAFLPKYISNISLDNASSMAIGAMVPPEFFTEVRYLAHKKQIDSIDIISCVGENFAKSFERDSGGLVRGYHLENAETIIVCMGSVAGTVKDVADKLNEISKEQIGVLSIISYRPFPITQIREALKYAKKVIVLEKAFAVGIGGIVSQEIELAIKGFSDAEVISMIAGLGGRAITCSMLEEAFVANYKEKVIFLGLKTDVITKEYQSIKLCCCKSKETSNV